MRKLQILFLLLSIKCSQVQPLIDYVKSLGETTKYIVFAILFIMGLFIAIAGINYKVTSIFSLLSLAIVMFFTDIYNRMNIAIQNRTNLFFLSHEYYVHTKDFIENHELGVFIALILFALVLAFLVVYIMKIVSIIGGVLVIAWLYNEVFRKDALLSIGIKNPTVMTVLFVFAALLIFYAFRKVPDYVLAIFFGIVGTFLIFLVVELVFGLDWGFALAYEELSLGKPVTNQPKHMVGFMIGAGACCVWQGTQVIKGKT